MSSSEHVAAVVGLNLGKSGQSASADVSDAGAKAPGAETAPATAAAEALVPRGWFSGTGGAVGVNVRVELLFAEESGTDNPLHVFVWSSATSDFDVPGVEFTLQPNGEFSFGPQLMEGMKGSVVSAIEGVWVEELEEVHLAIHIKLSYFVPSFTLTAKLIAVDEPVRAVESGLKLKRRARQ